MQREALEAARLRPATEPRGRLRGHGATSRQRATSRAIRAGTALAFEAPHDDTAAHGTPQRPNRRKLP
jgi:hypothetical protein